MPDPPYILPLDTLTRADAHRAGAKAATLGDLTCAGFPVPDGFVLTTEAYARFLASHALHRGSSMETAAAALVPQDVVKAVLAAAARFDAAPVAVRSSAVAEDLPGSSFAGQYETVLDVRGPDALLDAVHRCWASAFSARVATYRARRLQGGAHGMALLVQRLIPAEAAGVAFTADPVTGDGAVTVINAVRGLGERLVSGQGTPDEWLVYGQDAVCRRAPEGAIDAATARAVAALARRVATYLGRPQDVEWALAGGELFVLQARPITAVPGRTEAGHARRVEPPSGFWQREASHYPRPLSPMTRSTVLPCQNAGLRRVFEEFSLLLDGLELREIGGWIYLRRVPLGVKDRALPAWLMPLLVRVMPSLRTRIKGCVEAIRSGKAASFIPRWDAEWRPQLVARIAELRGVDFRALPDELLDAHVSRVMALLDEGTVIHFYLHGGLCMALSDLAFTCRDLLRWDDRPTFALLAGLSATSSEPARRLAELARMARGRPAVCDLLEHVDEGTMARLADVDGEFAAAFTAYQHEFGFRTLRYEVAELTMVETPLLVLELIHDQFVRGYDPAAHAAALERQRAARIAEARAALAARTAVERDRFERALAAAEQAYPVREDSAFYTVGVLLALLRDAVLEVGRRLTERGWIERRDDVFLFELPEARAALRHGGDQRALVQGRRAERRRVEETPGPATYGVDPGTPPLDTLPAEARFATEALLFTIDRILALGQSGHRQGQSVALRGVAAAPGMYTGPARVIQSEAEFARIERGDVLVCPVPSPAWSVLFSRIGALVTDTGGVLSHAAIIAREYRVPAVVASGHGTHMLRDGQIVTVDGNTGDVWCTSP